MNGSSSELLVWSVPNQELSTQTLSRDVYEEKTLLPGYFQKLSVENCYQHYFLHLVNAIRRSTLPVWLLVSDAETDSSGDSEIVLTFLKHKCVDVVACDSKEGIPLQTVIESTTKQ